MNVIDIIGFAEPRGEKPADRPCAQFDLSAELRQARHAEIARITKIAEQLARQFGNGIAAGFLYTEILGRLPEGADWARYVEGRRGSAATVPAIVAELLATAGAKDACRQATASAADPDRPAK